MAQKAATELWDNNQPEAYIEVAAGGVAVVAAIRCAAEQSVIAPAAAAIHAVGARFRACRIILGVGWIIPIPVAAPFPYVAAHVVNPKFIGLFLPHCMCL